MSAKDFSDTKPMSFYEAAIGERNQNYYLSKFENFDAQGPGLHASWNWAAFFFTGFWALYRKMYGWFVAWIFIPFFLGIADKVATKTSTGALWPLAVNLVVWIGFTVYANSLYHHKVKARIAASQKSKPNVFSRNQGQAFSGNHPPGNEAYATALAEIEEGRLDKGIWARSFAESGGDESKAKAAYIKVRAGAFQNAVAGTIQQDMDSNSTANGITSGVNMWVPIGFGGLVLLGIVAAIALPAYQDLTKRQAVVESPVQTPASAAPIAIGNNDKPGSVEEKWWEKDKLAPKPSFDAEGWTQDSTGSAEVGPWLNYSPAGTRYCRYADRTIYRLYPPGVMPNAEKANPFCVGDSRQFPDELR